MHLSLSERWKCTVKSSGCWDAESWHQIHEKVYLPTWMVDLFMVNVRKYTIITLDCLGFFYTFPPDPSFSVSIRQISSVYWVPWWNPKFPLLGSMARKLMRRMLRKKNGLPFGSWRVQDGPHPRHITAVCEGQFLEHKLNTRVTNHTIREQLQNKI